MRQCEFHRKTSETEIYVSIHLDGTGRSEIETPIPFLSHMLEQIARHGLFDLTIRAQGDVQIDGHHTTEDTGISLGEAFSRALGDKKGIQRYGWSVLPMDEARASCSLDLSGRTFFVFDADLPKAKIGSFDVELAEVFFEGFARGAMCNLHLVKERGTNLHHIIEIMFKSFAKALMMASRMDGRVLAIPSTKGTLSA